MRFCVVGRNSDPLSTHTEAVARARGHEVLQVSLREPAAFDGTSWLVRGEDLGAYDGFVVRQVPAAHALLGPPDEARTGADWFRLGMAQQERVTFAVSALMDLELQGKRIVNPPLASAPYDHKPLQLAVFQRAGLPIPRTLVTSWPEAVRIFEADVGELVAKPAAGGAEAALLDDGTRAKLPAIEDAPAIFQERVRGADVRVTLVGGRVISSVIIESDTLDYRSGDAYRAGDARYLDHPLPRAAEDLCVRAAALCHHVLSGVDLKLRADGGYTLLEANSAPVYLDIEQKTGAPITPAIVEWLERTA